MLDLQIKRRTEDDSNDHREDFLEFFHVLSVPSLHQRNRRDRDLHRLGDICYTGMGEEAVHETSGRSNELMVVMTDASFGASVTRCV